TFEFVVADCDYPDELFDRQRVDFCVGPDNDGDGLCNDMDEDPNDPCVPDFLRPLLTVLDTVGQVQEDGGSMDLGSNNEDVCGAVLQWTLAVEEVCGIAETSLTLTNDTYAGDAPVATLTSAEAQTYLLYLEPRPGSNRLTLMVTDNYGNPSSFTYTFTVTDDRLPTANCLNPTVELDDMGDATITVADVDDNSTDACGPVQKSIDLTAFDCEDVGVQVVTLTVRDAFGNESECEASVTVEDNILPDAQCQAVLVELDAAGNGSITPAEVDNNSSDNCGIASLSLDQTDFSCAQVGDNTVTLTVTDVNGNENTCTATVTVEDNILPDAQCQAVTIQLDANGNASITTDDIDNNSSDNCGIANLTLSRTDFSCPDAGTQIVSLLVTDVNGNNNVCEATVTVLDNNTPGEACDQDADGTTIAEGDPDDLDPCVPDIDVLVCPYGDFDEDGVPNSVEVAEGTDPADGDDFLDSDEDGTPDYVEIEADYPDSDVDGDGIPDGVETGGQNPYADNDGDGIPFYLDDDDNDPEVGDEDGTFLASLDQSGSGTPDFQEISVCQDCEVRIDDPCACLDNAEPIDLNDMDARAVGQFAEYISISGPGGAPISSFFEFRVVAVSGALDAYNVPSVGTQSAGVPVSVGTVLTYNAVTNNGHHELPFVHLDNEGYSISVQQFAGGEAVGPVLTISNRCAYPEPAFSPFLSPTFCEAETALPLAAIDLRGVGGTASFTINGQPATVFDPDVLGRGVHQVEMTFIGNADANNGVSPDGGITSAFPGCTQTVVIDVAVGEVEVGCIGDINVTLGADCRQQITPAMVLTGTYTCADAVIIDVNGSGEEDVLGCGNNTYTVEVIVNDEVYHTCWGNIFAEDKTAPVIECPVRAGTGTADVPMS
ncbi:MAG: hypothetical protein D6772_14375, partial [Bacteroidetes bacterium]